MNSSRAKPLRVYQLAHHLNLSSATLIDELNREGFILGKQHLTPITEQMLDKVTEIHIANVSADPTLKDFRSTVRQWERENPAAPILSRRHDMQKETIGKKLRYWRKSKKMSQKALADKAGVSPVTINQLETKDRTPRAQTFDMLLGALSITREQFFAEADKRKAEVIAEKPSAAVPKRARRIRLSNIDLELINQSLNLTFDEKIAVLKYIDSL
jgi:transcriptional regulator with XRE-family HTH domain